MTEVSSSRARARGALRRLLPVVVIAVTFACFTPALRNGFVDWDDDLVLTDNPRYRGFTPSHLRWMFTTAHGGHYEPLTWLTFALDHAFWGMDPRGYHLTNILLHSVNAALVLALAVALLRHAGALDGDRLRLAAAAGALFFAVHPLRVESVAWAVERRDVLCGVFYLLAVLAYLRRQRSSRPQAWLAASLGCFALSLLAKAWGMTLPLVLLVLDAYPLGRRTPTFRRLALEKLAYLPFAAAAAVMAVRTLAEAGSLRPSLAEYGVGQRLAQASLGLCFYVWKTLIPTGLSPLYPFDRRLDPTAPRYLVCEILVLLGAALLVAVRRRAPWALAAGAIYAIAVSPVLGFAQSGPHTMADRYSYIACLPWAVLMASMVHAAAGLGPFWRRGTAVLTVGVLVVLAVLTDRQTRVWKDSITLWTQAIRVDGTNAAAYVNRGWAKEIGGDVAGAVKDYEAALRLDPEDPVAWERRGLVRQRVGDLVGAIADYGSAIRVKPDYARARYNRGTAWQALGKTEPALADYTSAIRLNPRDPRALNNRGVLRASQGDLGGAIDDYSQALRLDPGFLLAWMNRARARRSEGDVAGAVADVETAMRLAPRGWPGCDGANELLSELGIAEARPTCGDGPADALR